MKIPIVDEMIVAIALSRAELKNRIHHVRYGPIEDGISTFLFELDTTAYIGYQKERFRDVVIGLSKKQDKRIVVAAILAGLAIPNKEN